MPSRDRIMPKLMPLGLVVSKTTLEHWVHELPMASSHPTCLSLDAEHPASPVDAAVLSPMEPLPSAFLQVHDVAPAIADLSDVDDDNAVEPSVLRSPSTGSESSFRSMDEVTVRGSPQQSRGAEDEELGDMHVDAVPPVSKESRAAHLGVLKMHGTTKGWLASATRSRAPRRPQAPAPEPAAALHPHLGKRQADGRLRHPSLTYLSVPALWSGAGR